jgi:carbamoyl-phosphate synthase large subunit
MNILITSAGQRVSLVRAFQCELKKMYPQQKVFTTDMVPELSAACQVSDQYFKVKRVTDAGYIEELLSICTNNGIKMIVPTIDTELLLLAQHKPLFCQEGIHLIVSSMSFVEKCRDKRIINNFFIEKEISIPIAVDRNNPTFPLFIKPHNGSLSVNTHVVRCRTEFTSYQGLDDTFLFMEYLDKEEFDEYTSDIYYDRNGYLKCVVPRKRLMVRAGEISKGITCKNKLVSYFKEKLDFIEGAVGCLTVQCFLHKATGSVKAIEINARFGGGFPLSYHAGAKYPLWLIQEYFQGHEISYTEDWEDSLLMLRYDDEVIIHGNQYQTK